MYACSPGDEFSKKLEETMKRLFCVLTLAAFAPAMWADLIFTGTLTGSGENPPNASPATGFIVVDLHNDGITLDVTESFSGLTVPASAAHIHCCAGPGTNAPVVLNFVGAGFPVGVTAGTFAHTFDLATDLAGISLPAFTTALESGQTYANIHDANFPGGEIRGQLLEQVPEPSTFPLLGG